MRVHGLASVKARILTNKDGAVTNSLECKAQR